MLIQAQNRFGRLDSHASTARDADPRLNILRDLARRLQRAAQRLSDDQNAEHVHDTRVSARRLRAWLRALRDEMHPGAYAALRFDLVNVGRELADVRAADTQLAMLRELSSATKHLRTKDMLMMIALCERRAAGARQSLAQRLREPAWSARLARIAAACDGADLLLRQKQSPVDECRRILAAELRSAARALRKRQSNTGMRALHRQRIRVKRARYVCEQLQPWIDCDLAAVQERLAQAQTIVGDAHDLRTLSTWLKGMPMPRTLHEPLLKRIARSEHKLIKAFRRRLPALRRRLRRNAALAARAA